MRYEELVREKRVWYKAVGKSHCPILKQDVFFTSTGFHHLMYDGLGHARSRKERVYRLSLLPLAIPVLKRATNIDNYALPAYSKSLGKNVEYWTIRAVVGKGNVLITVILRRIGTGNIAFYSIWKRKGGATKKPSR